MNDIKRAGYSPYLHTRMTNYYDWLSEWKYRQPVVISDGLSGTQTDYQLKLDIPYNGSMKTDFSDIRFTESDGTTLIDAWLETKINGTSSEVWVEFPITNKNYYMYYGNTDVSDYWDIFNTAVFGDDFSSADGFASRWSGAYNSISGGAITLTNGDRIDSVASYGVGYACRSKLNPATIVGNGGIGVGFGFHTVDANVCAIDYYQTALNIYTRTKKATVATTVSRGASTTGYHVQESIRESITSNKFRIDGGTLWEITTNIPTVDLPVSIATRAAFTENTICDWIFVHKYVANPPTYSFGAQEYY